MTRTAVGVGIALSVGLAACATGAPAPIVVQQGDDAAVADAAPEGAATGTDAATVPEGGASDAGCNSTTCLGGCCTAAGACVGGLDDGQCGKGGLVCLDCTSMGLSCNNQGCAAAMCTGCAGCCSGMGCQPGLSDQACGAKGAVCIDCSSQGLACGNGFCM